MKQTFVYAITVMILASPVYALDGLSFLQKAAQSDQATECMVHEYTRRYNEVLRDFSKKHKQWVEEIDAKAHDEAMKWVQSVWQNTDQNVLRRNLQSAKFLKAVQDFRLSQRAQYPHLQVVP